MMHWILGEREEEKVPVALDHYCFQPILDALILEVSPLIQGLHLISFTTAGQHREKIHY